MTESEHKIAPEPFLTILSFQGDSGIALTCPELEIQVGMGIESEDTAKALLFLLAESHSRALLNRYSQGTHPKDTRPSTIELARKIVDSIEQGFNISELFKK